MGACLVNMNNHQYYVPMARPKKFAQRIMVRFPEGVLKDVHSLLGKNEDRSDFLRQAAELEIAIRRLDIYPEFQGYLTANETIADFCAKAVKRAILARIASLTNEDIEPIMSNTEKANLNKKI